MVSLRVLASPIDAIANLLLPNSGFDGFNCLLLLWGSWFVLACALVCRFDD